MHTINFDIMLKLRDDNEMRAQLAKLSLAMRQVLRRFPTGCQLVVSEKTFAEMMVNARADVQESDRTEPIGRVSGYYYMEETATPYLILSPCCCPANERICNFPQSHLMIVEIDTVEPGELPEFADQLVSAIDRLSPPTN